jgi:hypothetical protein
VGQSILRIGQRAAGTKPAPATTELLDVGFAPAIAELGPCTLPFDDEGRVVRAKGTELGQRALRDRGPVIHEHRPIARLLDLRKDVTAHQHERGLTDLTEQGPEGRSLHGIKSRTGFIEQHDARAMHQARRQPGALAEAGTERAAQSIPNRVEATP